MYSSNISSSSAIVETTTGQVMCGDRIGLGFELYGVEWWLSYNIDGFGPVYFDEWAKHWFLLNINEWSF